MPLNQSQPFNHFAGFGLRYFTFPSRAQTPVWARASWKLCFLTSPKRGPIERHWHASLRRSAYIPSQGRALGDGATLWCPLKDEDFDRATLG
jgi:hypothetical protein